MSRPARASNLWPTAWQRFAAAEHVSLATHHRVMLLGFSLLFSCATVAAIALWAISTVKQSRQELMAHDGPGLTLLLRIDRDLYESEAALLSATKSTDPAQQDHLLSVFRRNVVESAQNLNAFGAVSIGGDNEEAQIKAYQLDREDWLEAADQLVNATRLSDSPSQSASPVSRNQSIQPLFDKMEAHLRSLIDEVYQPAVTGIRARISRESSLTCYTLMVAISVAMMAGIVMTRSVARTLLIQERVAESMGAEREQQNRRQNFEARLSRGLNMTQDEPATLRLVQEVIGLAAPSVKAEVLLADSSRAHLVQAAKTDRTGDWRGCSVAKPSDCPAVRRGHRLSFESGSMFDACPYLKDRPDGNCSAVCVPLSIMGQTVGVVHAISTDGILPPEEEIQALEQIASKSGERIGLLRAFRRTEAQASSDPLTGLMNRRSLEEHVHQLTRQQTPYAVAYGDLDNFKNLNDTHGHETGDRALRTFAQVLKSSFRPGDLTARWGGEEFVIVLPRASCEEAVGALERVRAMLIQNLRGAATPPFTVSFGVAHAGEGSLFADVLARADDALMTAKREGKNRTIITQNTPVSSRAVSAGAKEDNELLLPAA